IGPIQRRNATHARRRNCRRWLPESAEMALQEQRMDRRTGILWRVLETWPPPGWGACRRLATGFDAATAGSEGRGNGDRAVYPASIAAPADSPALHVDAIKAYVRGYEPGIGLCPWFE